MLAPTLNHKMYVERDDLKMRIENVSIQLTLLSKEQHMFNMNVEK
jgi:hypothetical protein